MIVSLLPRAALLLVTDESDQRVEAIVHLDEDVLGGSLVTHLGASLAQLQGAGEQHPQGPLQGQGQVPAGEGGEGRREEEEEAQG